MVQFTSLASVPALLATVLLCSVSQAQQAPQPVAPPVAPVAPPVAPEAAPALPPPPVATVAVAPLPAPPAPPPPAPPSRPAAEGDAALADGEVDADAGDEHEHQRHGRHERHHRHGRGSKHEGFYLRLGGGPSLISLNGKGPGGDDAHLRGSGSGGFLAIGGALVPGLVLAGTLQGVGLEQDFKGGPLSDATITANGVTRNASRKATGGFGMVGALIDWYPRPRGGWHTGVAGGLGVVALKNSADDSELAGLNFTGSVFGGYDWTIARDFSVGLQLTASGGTKTKMKEDDGDRDSGYRLTPLSIGVQASVLYF